MRPVVLTCTLLAGSIGVFVCDLGWADHGGLELSDVARLRSVSSAHISPDGTRVAITLEVPRDLTREDDGPAWSELHVIDGQGSRGLLVGEVVVRDVAWLGNGLITYRAKKESDDEDTDDDHWCLYGVAIDGGSPQLLLDLGRDLTGYTWSKQGDRLAFLATEPEDPDRERVRDKGFDQKVFEEDTRAPHLWIARRVVETTEDGAGEAHGFGVLATPQRLTLPGVPSDPVWGPAGKRIALAIAPTAHVDDHYMRRRVRIVSASTGEVLTRIENPGKLGPIAWSPNGERICYISAADLHDPSPGRLMVANADGTELRDVFRRIRGHIRDAHWLDDETILYFADRRVETHFGKILLNATYDVRRNPSADPVVTAISVSDNGKVVVLGHTSKHPSEAFLYDHMKLGFQRITTVNPWLDEKRFAKQEAIRYQTRDDLQIDGILLHPLERAEDERVPLIVVVHGGPESHYANGWVTAYSRPGQVAAARGFAVFYPNYRASTGRGVAFSKLDHGDFAGKEFDDIVDGVKHLVASGLVDGGRVGVTGGSYGGYATAWCATALSQHFAAAVMYAGISNQISFTGTTDIPEEMSLVHYRVRPWENWQLHLERSPIYRTENATTPILICHGKNDTRVHPGQSLELYRYLKSVGSAPVRLVLYEGEGHSNRRAASRLDYSMRVLRWMEHYLRGPGGDPPPYVLDYGMDFPAKENEADAKPAEGR